MTDLPREALIKLPEVLRYTGLCKSEVYEKMREGSFPIACELGPKSVAWVWGEIADWNMARRRVPSRLAMPRPVATTGYPPGI